MCLLLFSIAVALCPFNLDELRNTCHFQAKAQKDIIQDAPIKVKQEMMMAFLLSSAPVNHDKLRVLAQPPPESQTLRIFYVFRSHIKVKVCLSADVTFSDSF